MKRILLLTVFLFGLLIQQTSFAQEPQMSQHQEQLNAQDQFNEMLDDLESESTLYKALGYSFLGVGAGLLGAGLGISYYYSNDYQDAYERNERNEGVSSDELRTIKKEDEKKMFIGNMIHIFGGAMLITGITLVIIDAAKIRPQINKLNEMKQQTTAKFNLSPVFSPEFKGLMLSATF